MDLPKSGTASIVVDRTSLSPSRQVYEYITSPHTPVLLQNLRNIVSILSSTYLYTVLNVTQGEYVYPDRRCLVAEQVYKIRQQAEYLRYCVHIVTVG